MLKTKEGRVVGPVPRWGRALLVALLAAAVVGVSALRCPAQKVGGPVYAVTFTDGGTVAEKDAAPAAPEPFDLSYLPPDAMGVVCVRPSALLGRPGLKKDADAANKGIGAASKAIGLSRAFGLPVEEIAQVSMTVSIKTDKKAKGPQSALMVGAPAMVRATKDFDWAAEIKALLPGVKEVRHGDRVVYQLPTDGPLLSISLGMKMCFYVPDARTVVFATEEQLGRLIDRKSGDAPAWAADFKGFERGLAAVVLDNRNGAWGRELAARDESDPDIAPFQDHTSWVMVGFSADDDFVADASARFDGEETAEKAVKAIEGGLADARDALATPESFWAALGDDPKGADGPAKNAGRKEYAFFKALVQAPELKRDGASVRLRCRVKGDVTEILTAILNGEIGL